MPALKGSLTYMRFFVEGEVPDAFHDRFLKAIRLRAMRPLEPDDEDLERTGWCRIGEPFELDLGHEDVFYNEYLNLGLRTDRWVIPGPMLRARMREAEALVLTRKGRERLTRSERAELKTAVARKLRKQLSPAVRAVDLSWSVHDGIVRFFSHAPRAAALVTELFSKTFGLKLIPEAPYTLGARLGLTRAQLAAWSTLEPTVVATEVG